MHMTSLTIPAQRYLLPRDADAVGPQNEAERRLYKLVKEGIDSGPSDETSITELTAELRARIRSKQ
jgi:Arc/MetJ-type ribon-helix-helix transcriptional regulator